jgi:hypothetical protein
VQTQTLPARHAVETRHVELDIKLSAEPERCINVTAPVAALARLRPALRIR